MNLYVEEMTSQWIYKPKKWQVYDFVGHWNDKYMNLFVKKHLDEFIGQRNDKLMNLYSKEMTTKWICRSLKWQVDEFVGHWNDMLMR